jgi:hypothetical protein
MSDGPQPPSDVVRLETALGNGALRAKDEYALQDHVERLLSELHVRYEREKRLTARDRPDFWLPDSNWIVEVKLRYPAGRTDAQLVRYAALDVVAGILLISVKQHTCPALYCGKPVRTISLWKQAMA